MSDIALDPALQRIVSRVDAVRRRLAMTNLLRWIASFLGAILLFVVFYAWLDHHFHFGPVLRLLTLGLLATGIAVALYRFAMDVRSHINLEHAARYIEHRSSCRQQLLAAVEYYANREDYAYSESLAHFMIHQVDQHTAQIDWAQLVPRWPRFLSIAVIVLGALATGWMAWNNGSYFLHYMARLVQPTASIAPLPATTLALSEAEVVAAERSNFEIAAEIGGDVPEVGHLMLTPQSSTEESPTTKRIRLHPMEDESGSHRFALLTQLPLGEYTFQFETGDVQSAIGTIRIRPRPDLASISAHVTPPPSLDLPPYDELIEEGKLEVIEGSEVVLTLTGTVALSKGTVQTGENAAIEVQGNDGPTLHYSFTADTPTSLTFSLTSDEGLVNDALPPLAVSLLKDEKPHFTYVSPGSDYLATNVASIPLEFTIEDDFGLRDAALVLEIDGRPATRIPATLEQDGKSTTIQHLLELEDHDLSVGDTILVYATATETASALKKTANRTQSEVNFVEIRAYNQIVYQASESMGGNVNPSRGLDGERLPTLLQVLEYTRAIMKKTWSLQDAAPFDDEELRKADGIATDASFIADKVTKIKKATQDRVTPEQTRDMGQLATELFATGSAMTQHRADEALEPTKQAYRIARKLVDELEKGEPPPGSGSQRDQLDSIKLEEQVHLTRFEDEQVQWELKKLAEELDTLREKQKELARRFERFLLNQAQQEGHTQKITDEETKVQQSKIPQDDSATSPDSSGGGGTPSRMTKEGSLLPQTGNPKSGRSSAMASPEEILAMFQAAQDKLEGEVAKLESEIRSMAAQGESAASGSGSLATPTLANTPNSQRPGERKEDEAKRGTLKDAADALARAREAMEGLQEQAAARYFDTDDGEKAGRQTREALKNIDRALEEGGALMEGVINRESRARTADMLAAQAEKAAEIARALEENLDPIEEERLQSELMELTETGHTGGSNYVQHFRGAGVPPRYIALVDSIVPPADKSNLPAFIDTEPRRAARYLAEKFWTLAIQADKEQGALRENEAADAEYRAPERSFYESAARFNGETIR